MAVVVEDEKRNEKNCGGGMIKLSAFVLLLAPNPKAAPSFAVFRSAAGVRRRLRWVAFLLEEGKRKKRRRT